MDLSLVAVAADHLDNWNDMAVSYGKDTSSESVIAENPRTKQVFRVSQLQNADLDKYLEDIRQGVYPLTAWGVDSPTTSLLTTPAQSTRDEGESFGMVDEFEEDFVSEVETRLIMSCMCTIRSKHDTPVGSVCDNETVKSIVCCDLASVWELQLERSDPAKNSSGKNNWETFPGGCHEKAKHSLGFFRY